MRAHRHWTQSEADSKLLLLVPRLPHHHLLIISFAFAAFFATAQVCYEIFEIFGVGVLRTSDLRRLPLCPGAPSARHSVSGSHPASSP